MITKITRVAYIAEAITAVRLGALCDQWAASAARRLVKLSARFPQPQGERSPFRGVIVGLMIVAPIWLVAALALA